MHQAWLTLSMLAAIFVLAACGGGSGSGLAACPTPAAATAQASAQLTVEELMDLVAGAATCPGYALHLQGETVSAIGEDNETFLHNRETDAWIDIAGNVSRSDTYVTAISDEARRRAEDAGEDVPDLPFLIETRIATSDGVYARDGEDVALLVARPSSCRVRPAALALLFDCGLLQPDVPASVARDVVYGPDPVIALTGTAPGEGPGEPRRIHFGIYLDQETLLPVGSSEQNRLDILGWEEFFSLTVTTQWQATFVPLDSLPDGLFDPASIGYTQNEVES